MSNIKLTAKGRVENGRLDIRNQERNKIRDNLSELEGCDVEVIVQERRRPKSSRVRGYYWSSIIPFVRDCFMGNGYYMSEKDIHELMKYWFNKKCIVNEETGEVMEFPGSTESNTPEEDTAFIERIAEFVSKEFGAQLPEPDSGVSYRMSGDG